MTTVFIENLVFEGVHGVTAREQERVQPFRIDIEAEVNACAGGDCDAVGETADYRLMKRAAESVVAGERHALLETIAKRIAVLVLKDERVRQVVVSVRKLTIWQSGVPGVRVVRART